MTYTNMKTPPPVVTGFEIPADLGIKKVDRYEEIKNLRRQVRDEFYSEQKHSDLKVKSGRKKHTFIKVLAGIAAAAALIFGGKKIAGKLIKH